jgi:hypothetical protein
MGQQRDDLLAGCRVPEARRAVTSVTMRAPSEERVLSAALRGEPTGQPQDWRGDVVAVAKRDLSAGETLDGEGGYTVWGKLVPSERRPRRPQATLWHERGKSADARRRQQVARRHRKILF